MREIRLYGSEGGGAVALPTPISQTLGLTGRLSLNLLHRSKDSTDLDFGLEFDWHPMHIIGEPNLKRPTTLKQPSKD